MASVRTLRKEGRKCAEWRNHTLGRFSPLDGSGWVASSVARCTRCRAEVRVEPTPAPNSVSLWGEALAVNCA
jgi:hypothetical protein